MSGRKDTDANSATPALAGLDGFRLAVCSEPPAGSTFDNAVLKALTGETQIEARDLFERGKEKRKIHVTFHIWLLCNAKPKVEHLEQAIAGRIHMLPFDRQWNRPGHPERDPALPDGDKHLAEALAGEEEGILVWLVAGAVKYFAEGLEPCPEVVAATRTYFDEQRVDAVGQWLAEQERCGPRAGTGARAAFAAFSAWRVAREAAGSLRAGDSPLNETAFGRALKKQGVEKTDLNSGARYGIRLVSDFDSEPDDAAKAEYERLVAGFGDLA